MTPGNLASHVVVCLLGTTWAVSAQAPVKSYMTLVGDLVSAAEGPRIVKEVCVSRFPKKRMEFEEPYSAWRARHVDLLKAIDEQVVRANARLVRQGAPPGTSVVTTMNSILHRPFDSLDAGKARQLCDAYPQLLKVKDEEMKSSVPALLDTVASAERTNP